MVTTGISSKVLTRHMGALADPGDLDNRRVGLGARLEGSLQLRATVRRGKKYFDAEWMPTRCRARFETKREATAFVKAHEKRAYGKAS